MSALRSLTLTVLARKEALKDAERMLSADALCMRSEQQQQLHLVSLPLSFFFGGGWGAERFTHSAVSAPVLTCVNPPLPPNTVCHLKMVKTRRLWLHAGKRASISWSKVTAHGHRAELECLSVAHWLQSKLTTTSEGVEHNRH